MITNLDNFHPSLHSEKVWYRCHPAFGALLYERHLTLPEVLDDLGKDHPWHKLTEAEKDEILEEYSRKILGWFGQSFKPELYFSGAYERTETELIRSAGLDYLFKGVWEPEYEEPLTSVNVHELALVSRGSELVIYESWDNIFTTLDKIKLPEELSEPWV